VVLGGRFVVGAVLRPAFAIAVKDKRLVLGGLPLFDHIDRQGIAPMPKRSMKQDDPLEDFARRADADEHQTQAPPPVGIDFLALVEQEHRDAARQAINFADLPRGAEPDGHVYSDHNPSRTGLWHEPPLPLAPDDSDRDSDDDPDQEAAR
jgi:hypothetical protein